MGDNSGWQINAGVDMGCSITMRGCLLLEYNIFGVIFAVLFFGYMFFALVVGPLIEDSSRQTKINKANKEWEEKHGKKQKKRCVDCWYCKTTIYKPFYTSYALAMRVPSYCRKFRRKLDRTKENQRCIAELLQDAELED